MKNTRNRLLFWYTDIMNESSIIKQLTDQYLGRNIITMNDLNGKPSEIICELGNGKAIAVIDASQPHYHKKITETYIVLNGELSVFLDEKETRLRPGDRLIIKPGVVHYALGQEAWVEVIAEPEWTPEDHFLA